MATRQTSADIAIYGESNENAFSLLYEAQDVVDGWLSTNTTTYAALIVLTPLLIAYLGKQLFTLIMYPRRM